MMSELYGLTRMTHRRGYKGTWSKRYKMFLFNLKIVALFFEYPGYRVAAHAENITLERMKSMFRVCLTNRLRLLLVIVLSVEALSVSAQTGSFLVSERISQYRQAYPEIEFKLLYTMEDYDEILPLTESLGKDLSNPEYEHPEDARITLVEAQEYRIARLIDNDMSSATLFKTPNANITDHPYVCLITMNHQLSDWDPLAATRFMYDLDEETIRTMPISLRLNNRDFLLFTIDHEIFHCIDTYTNGFLFPKTLDEITASKNRARAEIRTEAFAAMAHLSRQPDGKNFLNNLANARTLNLFSWDVEHYTAEVLNRVVETSELITTEDIRILVEQSTKMASGMTPTLLDYKEFIVAVWAALEEYGVDVYKLPAYYEDLIDILPPIPGKVEAISNKIKEADAAIQCNL